MKKKIYRVEIAERHSSRVWETYLGAARSTEEACRKAIAVAKRYGLPGPHVLKVEFVGELSW